MRSIEKKYIKIISPKKIVNYKVGNLLYPTQTLHKAVSLVTLSLSNTKEITLLRKCRRLKTREILLNKAFLQKVS